MHFFQFAATWLFPCAVFATMAPVAAAMAEATDGVEEGSAPSPAFSAGGVNAGADPGSSPSASSSTTSSSTSSLLGSRCGSPDISPSQEKQDGGGPSTPKADAVRLCLRRLARRLRRAAGADDVRPDARRGRKKRRSMNPDRRVVDGTAREREEAVATAITYCKETKSGRRSGTGTSSPPPSHSLDGGLLDRPAEASRCKRPALRRDVSLLEWLPEAPACTSGAAVPHHRRSASCDGYDGGKSVPDTAKPATRRCVTGELGVGDIYDGLDIDVLRITNYFATKYVPVRRR